MNKNIKKKKSSVILFFKNATVCALTIQSAHGRHVNLAFSSAFALQWVKT